MLQRSRRRSTTGLGSEIATARHSSIKLADQFCYEMDVVITARELDRVIAAIQAHVHQPGYRAPAAVLLEHGDNGLRYEKTFG